MGTVAWFGFHLLVGALGAWAARGYARRRALLDHPGERRSHDLPTPRGGGVAVAASLLLASAWLAWRFPAQVPLVAVYGVGLALVSSIGWVDDHRPLPAWSRFIVHVVAGGVFALGCWLQSGDTLATAVAFAGTVVLVNAWNFMDGIHGLAATQAMLVALMPAVLAAPPTVALALALVASTLGFLPWNFPRARLFLGDVGSGALGFAIAALVAMATLVEGPRALVLALFPLAAFLLDTGLTLARRIVEGERWWQPHVSHAYQHAARRWGHASVTTAFAAWTTAALLAVWTLHDVAVTTLTIALVPWYASGALVWWVLGRRRRLQAMENRE